MNKRALAFGLTFTGWMVAACSGTSDNGGSAPDAATGDDAAGTSQDATLPSSDASPLPGVDGSTPNKDATAASDTGTATDGGSASDTGTSTDTGTPTDAGADADASTLDLSSQDITFFAFGDPQFGGGPADKNSFHIQALNAAPALTWPTDAGFVSAGNPVGDPRGVIIAGDLTQNGQAGRDPLREWYTTAPYQFDMNAQWGVNVPNNVIAAELGLFLRDYGLRGNDGLDLFVLKYRVFEGYGNHDFDTLSPDPGYDPVYNNEAPARDVVSIRNQVRAKWPEFRRSAPGNAGHYSWDWDLTHFVHMNLVASDAIGNNTDDDSGTQPPRDPQGALTFLQQDLAAEVGSSCRPVIIIMHYGFDPFSEEGRWWDEAQRNAFLQVVHPYNVAAILHGHVHETDAYTMSDGQGKTYDVFSLGSPYYQGQATNNGRGHFQAFHIKGKHIDGADISWLPANPDPAMADDKDLWTGKKLADEGFQITTQYSGGWGGWAFSKDIDVASCQAGYAPPDAGPPFCPPGGSVPSDAGANLIVHQPDPNQGANNGFAFNWDDSWNGGSGPAPDPAYQHMTSAVACSGPATHWTENGLPVGGWIKFFPNNTNQPSGQPYFLASPLVAGQSYTASITLFGSGAYHLNIWDGGGGKGIGDNAGASVTLDGVHATTLTVPFTMGTGNPEFQLRIDAAPDAGTASANVDITMWDAAIYAN